MTIQRRVLLSVVCDSTGEHSAHSQGSSNVVRVDVGSLVVTCALVLLGSMALPSGDEEQPTQLNVKTEEGEGEDTVIKQEIVDATECDWNAKLQACGVPFDMVALVVKALCAKSSPGEYLKAKIQDEQEFAEALTNHA